MLRKKICFSVFSLKFQLKNIFRNQKTIKMKKGSILFIMILITSFGFSQSKGKKRI